LGVGSLFVVGDVHGCAAELKTLLNKLPLVPESTVVFLGDYIDRGPQSRQVVDTILKLRTFCNVVTLSGNHEAMLQDFLEDPTSQGAGMFIYNGGGATLASYADAHGNYCIPEEHLEFFSSLKLSYQTPDFFFVHAGVPNTPLEGLDEREHRREMLWVRRTFHNSPFRWSKVIVHGHCPVAVPYLGERRINVDTGCVYHHVLTALELPSRKIYSVNRAKDEKQVHLRDFSSNRIAIRYKGAIPVYVDRDDQRLEFETIDYSEFGLLMRDIANHPRELFRVGEVVSGHIGSQDATLVEFTGTVLRVQEDDLGRSYAIKLASVGAPAD
jgi:serine/threonine protein phosphatase 1